jgi:hypothetical protein
MSVTVSGLLRREGNHEPAVRHAGTSRGSRSPVAAHPVTSAIIAILILASIFFAVYVPLYASATPMVGDFPFFYFYLLIYMPVLGVVMCRRPPRRTGPGR